MKKILFLFALSALITGVQAQDVFYTYYADGDVRTFPVTGIDSISVVKPDSVVIDPCGNMYHMVKIGDQVWLKENMRCNKYDTESEPYKEGVISIPFYKEYGPVCNYYEKCGNLPYYYINYIEDFDNDTVRAEYLYNWAAVFGYMTKNEIDAYECNNSRIQGICPNGFHVPHISDFWELSNSIGCDNNCRRGYLLKSKSGWNYNGTDVFGFCGLPSGRLTKTSQYDPDLGKVIVKTTITTEDLILVSATIDCMRTHRILVSTLTDDGDYFKNYDFFGNYQDGYAVRCIKNK